MDKKIPTYRGTVSNIDDTGIFAVSFVDYPAIERNFVALKKVVPVKLSIDRQKQLLTGALLIPDQLIYRNCPKRGEYYLTFTREDIEKIALKMMRKRDSLGNTSHQHEKDLKNNHLAELWIVNDPKRDKAVALGLGELPAGTLVVSYKIGDSSYWRTEVLSGNVRGFSLEGFFNHINITKMKKEKKTAEQSGNKDTAKSKGRVPAFFRSIAALLEGETEEAAEGVADEAKKDETDSGTPYLIFDLGEGGAIWVDEDGFCTLEGGEQMPSGEHTLADGNVIVIDGDGLLVITQPESEGTQPDEADVAMAKQRAKDFFAKKSPNETEIAKLKKRIAELEKKPSTQPAQPDVEGGGNKPLGETFTDKMAAVIAARRERLSKK